jgi:hypothetical protein
MLPQRGVGVVEGVALRTERGSDKFILTEYSPTWQFMETRLAAVWKADKFSPLTRRRDI